jgi:hypothetical protein
MRRSQGTDQAIQRSVSTHDYPLFTPSNCTLIARWRLGGLPGARTSDGAEDSSRRARPLLTMRYASSLLVTAAARTEGQRFARP